MTIDPSGADRILGSLRSAEGKGVVRIEDRIDAGINEVWSAITDPDRLAHWHWQASGDLRLGGEFRVYNAADDWEGTGRVEACDPPWRFVVTIRESEESWRKGKGVPPFDSIVDATLSLDGERSLLVVEVSGMPLDMIAFYGVGWQIHAENLAAYLAGRPVSDAEARWNALLPAYQDRAANLS